MTTKHTFTFGMILAMLIAVAFVNVKAMYAGNVEFASELLTVYVILLLFTLVIFHEEFPIIFDEPMDLVVFTLVFFISAIVFLTVPKIPASLVGSVADVVKAVSSTYFLQAFLAAFIETIVFIYAFHKKFQNPVVRFLASNIFFVIFHLAVIWGKLSDPAFAIYPWYVVIIVSSISLFVLNSVFQFIYIKSGKRYGLEATTAFHMIWDLKVFGILSLIFGGVVIAL